MREPFAHDAALRLEPGGDVRAPGAAITVALCGHWAHEPPCPLAAHHTDAEPAGDEISLRILFATEPGHEAEVRERIRGALRAGHLEGPDGRESRWRLVADGASEVRPQETGHARRLATG
jgi:hypothetical protein